MKLFFASKTICLSLVFALLSVCGVYGQVDCSIDAPEITIIENSIFEGEQVEIHFTGVGPVTILLDVSFLPFNVPVVMNSSPFFTAVPGQGTYEIIDAWSASCPGIVTGSPFLIVMASINLGPDLSICASTDPISFDAGPGYTDYTWSNITTGQTTTVDPSNLPIGSNVLTVSATNSINGSTGFGSVNINVLPSPGLVLSTQNVEICEGGYEEIFLNPYGGATPYEWSVDNPDGGSGPHPFLSGTASVNGLVQETGNWTFTIEDANGCEGTADMTVLVHPTPEGYATQDQWVCANETNPLRFPVLTAYDFDPSHTLTWTNLNDNMVVGMGNNISVNPTVETIYQVTIADAFGCFVTDELTIFMQDPALCGSAARSSELANSKAINSNNVLSFPNPFGDQLTINFEAADAGNYALEIWDVAGVHIKTIQIGAIDEQTFFSMSLDTQSWNEGTYILQFIDDKRMVVSKLIQKTRF